MERENDDQSMATNVPYIDPLMTILVLIESFDLLSIGAKLVSNGAVYIMF